MYDQLLANLAILVLSGFVGFAVISKVPNTLHTPLMSGTNAIHGIVVLGALIVLGSLPADAGWGVRIIAFVALIFGTLNVIGGFLVTDRMLACSRVSHRKTCCWRTEVNYLVNVLLAVAFAMALAGHAPGVGEVFATTSYVTACALAALSLIVGASNFRSSGQKISIQRNDGASRTGVAK